jgi:hypothetical protein
MVKKMMLLVKMKRMLLVKDEKEDDDDIFGWWWRRWCCWLKVKKKRRKKKKKMILLVDGEEGDDLVGWYWIRRRLRLCVMVLAEEEVVDWCWRRRSCGSSYSSNLLMSVQITLNCLMVKCPSRRRGRNLAPMSTGKWDWTSQERKKERRRSKQASKPLKIIASLCTLSPCVTTVASSGVVLAFIVLGWLLFLEFLAAVDVIWIPWAAPRIFQITQEATCKSAVAHKKPTRPNRQLHALQSAFFVLEKNHLSVFWLVWLEEAAMASLGFNSCIAACF